MLRYNQPYLEKYTGYNSRYECPACHDKHSFARYIDGNTDKVIHPSCGRCNHESSCGYHLTPKQYCPDYQPPKSSEVLKQEASPLTRGLGRIPKQYLIQSIGYESNFVVFLCSLFDHYTLESPIIERLMRDYYLGHTKDKAIIFWQVDGQGRIRTGKVMQYDPITGRRLRDVSGAIDWVHARLKREGVLPKDFYLVQCLFGEHLLAKNPDWVVALVESEKAAIIGSGVYPDYVWLATGGRSQLSIDKLRVLRGRTVIMFPDVDGYGYWTEKAKEVEAIGCKVMVSDLLEKNATAQDRVNKIDLADWLIRELQRPQPLETIHKHFTDEEKALHRLAAINPTVYSLIDDLDLVSTATGKRVLTHLE